MTEGKYEASGPGLEKAFHRINVNGIEVPFTIERPDHIHGAEDYATESVVLAPGWTETEDTLVPLRSELAKLGFAAITLHHPRGINLDKILSGAELRSNNISAISKFLVNEYFSVNLFGHSLGGIDITESTHKQEVPIKSMTLSNSGGLSGDEDLHGILHRFLNKTLKEESNTVLRAPISELRLIAKSVINFSLNIPLAACEAWAISNDIRTKVSEIHDSGVITSNFMSDNDHVFPHGTIIKKTAGVKFDSVKTFTDSCHNVTSHKPKEVAFAVAKIILDSEVILASRQKIAA